METVRSGDAGVSVSTSTEALHPRGIPLQSLVLPVLLPASCPPRSLVPLEGTR